MKRKLKKLKERKRDKMKGSDRKKKKVQKKESKNNNNSKFMCEIKTFEINNNFTDCTNNHI